MADLKTKFMGFEIKNPIVVGACNLSQDPETLLHLENAGAAAIVYKSLFEEQINLEKIQMEEDIHEFDERNAEMIDIFPKLKHAGPKEHLLALEKAKKALQIPLIASLNAVNKDVWIEYAELIEKTGVDGIELNFYSLPKDPDISELSIIDEQLEIVQELKKRIKIPVSVKLSPNYTNPLHVIHKLDKIGVEGFVLFNRLLQPDIDVEKELHTLTFALSNEGDYRESLRFAGLLHNKTNGNIASNTGIHTGEDVIKLLLAGSDSVQIVSAIYRHKPQHISNMLGEIEEWMKSHSYNSINDFKGKLSKDGSKDPFAYARAQYVNILLKPEAIMKRYPTI